MSNYLIENYLKNNQKSNFTHEESPNTFKYLRDPWTTKNLETMDTLKYSQSPKYINLEESEWTLYSKLKSCYKNKHSKKREKIRISTYRETHSSILRK